MKAAGSIVLGKTNTPEFAAGASGRDELSQQDQRTKTRQLHRLDRAGLPGHARQSARRERARRQERRRATGRAADRCAAVLGAAHSLDRQTGPGGASNRLAAAWVSDFVPKLSRPSESRAQRESPERRITARWWIPGSPLRGAPE